MKKILATSFMLCCIVGLHAQSTLDQNAADFLRKSDSVYAVISVLVTIFAGIIAFLVFQERKISKLEKQLKDHHQ